MVLAGLRVLKQRIWKRQVERTPALVQLHTTECGAACLGIVLAYFGLTVPMEELRGACQVNRDGSSAADIAAAARRYGLHVTGWRKEPEALRTMKMPVIAHWELNHFVVLEGYRQGRWRVNDPAHGRVSVSEEAFAESFTGIVLQPEPAPGFQRGGHRQGVWTRIWHLMRRDRPAAVFAALAGLLLTVPFLALPALLAAFVDEVLVGGASGWTGALVAGFAAAGVLVYLLVWLQQFAFRKLTVRLAVGESANMVWHLLHLPASYFEHRYAGDIASRVHLASGVAANAATGAALLAVELCMGVLLAVVLVAINPLLGIVVVAIAALTIAAMRITSRARTDHERQLGREQASLASIEAAGLRHIDHLRATAGEDDFFARWSGHQAREIVARQRFVELGHAIAALPGFASLLSATAVFGIGGQRVFSGDMTAGALVGFFALSVAFIAPVGRFANFADRLNVLEADLQRIDDVLDAEQQDNAGSSDAEPPDGPQAPTRVTTVAGRLRLAGQVELRDITFGYRRNAAPLIENFNLIVEPGQRVALVGTTGSGKSSVLSLVNGELEPWSGQVLFDGIDRGMVPLEVLHSSLATVDQRLTLFAATVLENLTMWNPSLDESQVIEAARDALCHEDILQRDGGYDARIDEEGRNFSGGQRQRLEIARALASNPTILLADEATSSLDAVTEQHIDDALRRRGITCILVAHRLSTIRDCDEIIVLERGRVVQRGTHDALVSDAGGAYASLVYSQ